MNTPTWFPQYEVPAAHRCWNSQCDCSWRHEQLASYKPNRQTLIEESCCTVSGDGRLTIILSRSQREVTVPAKSFDY